LLPAKWYFWAKIATKVTTFSSATSPTEFIADTETSYSMMDKIFSFTKEGNQSVNYTKASILEACTKNTSATWLPAL
jgi:hypothetical protein